LARGFAPQGVDRLGRWHKRGFALPKPAVIVVNSHVVRGAVGGRASVFALERMGFPVWSVPTVILPWHPGHGKASRLIFGEFDFAELVSNVLKTRSMLEVGALLTGYISDAPQIGMLAPLVEITKLRSGGALYLCDPVIGDAGGLFRPPDLAADIRGRLLPQADIATPNRHELEWLTGKSLVDNDALVTAAARLGPKEVVVTSAFASPGEIGTLVVTPEGAHLATHRMLLDAPHGTGDLFAALYLGHRLDGIEPVVALERSVAAVLRLVELAAERGADELPLAQGQDAFLAPPRGIAMQSVG
jgi:pyridoxine kinase